MAVILKYFKKTAALRKKRRAAVYYRAYRLFHAFGLGNSVELRVHIQQVFLGEGGAGYTHQAHHSKAFLHFLHAVAVGVPQRAFTGRDFNEHLLFHQLFCLGVLEDIAQRVVQGIEAILLGEIFDLGAQSQAVTDSSAARVDEERQFRMGLDGLQYIVDPLLIRDDGCWNASRISSLLPAQS